MKTFTVFCYSYMMQKVYLLLLLAVVVHGAKSKAKQPPNVIFILADDLVGTE